MKHRVKVELMGGVGNQLFQYFAGLNLANATNGIVDLVASGVNKHKSLHIGSDIMKLKPLEIGTIPSTSRPRVFDNINKLIFSLCVRSNIISRLVTSVGYISDPYLGKRQIEFSARNYYLKGYFQTHINFDSCTTQQKNLDLIHQSHWFTSVSKEILAANAVGIHIRRGDYLELSDSYGVLEQDYYKQAIKLARGSIDNPKFFVFSDDLGVARALIEDLDVGNCILVEPPIESNAVESLLLMSLCKGLIIANSSFSYWGALLGDEKRVVVFPKPWSSSTKLTEPKFPSNWINCESNLRD